MLCDSLQRKIDYLRFSVTDLCNIRCHYCMPAEGIFRIHRQELLTFEEITRLVKILVSLGIKKVRLTGGEPLVRRDLPVLVRMLHGVEGLEEILLTTNGVPLKSFAGPLREAGLQRINIHLDTLRRDRFLKITRRDELAAVLEGIEEAIKVGFMPIKLNVVVQRGLNDDEIEDLMHFSADRGLVLRLIEMMPIGPGRDLMPLHFISSAEIRDQLASAKLASRYTLTPWVGRLGPGPARYVKVEELGLLLGFISPISQPFCEDCNRIRISSDGRFQDCLAYDGTFSLKDLLRSPQFSDGDIGREVVSLLGGKREGHEGFVQLPAFRTPCMSGIGG